MTLSAYFAAISERSFRRSRAFFPGQPKTIVTRWPGYSAFTYWKSFSKLRRLWA